MKYADIVAAERRHTILKLLNGAGGKSSARALFIGIESLQIDARATYDDVVSDLRFLRDRYLVAIEPLDDTTLAATLTREGGAVLKGKREVEGVMAPDREI